jgi:hypothetical protein
MKHPKFSQILKLIAVKICKICDKILYLFVGAKIIEIQETVNFFYFTSRSD